MGKAQDERHLARVKQKEEEAQHEMDLIENAYKKIREVVIDEDDFFETTTVENEGTTYFDIAFDSTEPRITENRALTTIVPSRIIVDTTKEVFTTAESIVEEMTTSVQTRA